MTRYLALLLTAALYACAAGGDLATPTPETPEAPATPNDQNPPPDETPETPDDSPPSTNHAPTASSTSAYTTVDHELTGNVLTAAFDEDGDALTASVAQPPLYGTLELNDDGSYTYTPGPNYAGNDSFRWRAQDASAESDAATVTIKVDAAPVAQTETFHVQRGHSITITTLLANDSDRNGDPLVAYPSGAILSFNTTTGHVEYGGNINMWMDHRERGTAYDWNTNGGFTFSASADATPGIEEFSYQAFEDRAGLLGSAATKVIVVVEE